MRKIRVDRSLKTMKIPETLGYYTPIVFILTVPTCVLRIKITP